MKNVLLILFLLFLNRKAFSLVDYSEVEKPKFKASRPTASPSKAPAKAMIQRSAPSSPSSSSSALGIMELTTKYNNSKLQLSDAEANVSSFEFLGHIQTPYNIYFDLSYAIFSSDSDYLASTGQTQKGNPEVILGLNWLSFGSGADRTTVDLIAGLRVGQKGSDFATSRNDKIVALETTKHFQYFILGLGYQMTLTGSPDAIEEKDIGNIQDIYAKLGIVISHDIHFLLEARQSKVSAIYDSTHGLRLDRDLSFGMISPSLILGLSPLVNVELGGIFRTRRVENVSEVTNTRLYNVKGVYGNSLFAGLNINI